MHRSSGFLLILLLCLPFQALAQSNAQDNQFAPRFVMNLKRNMERNDQTYRDSLEKLERSTPLANDEYANLVSLKSYYPLTSFYEADSDKLVDQLMQYAFTYDTQEDPVKASQTLFEYNKFLKEHLMDIQVVYMAYNLCKQDASFGNAAFLNKVIALLENMVKQEMYSGESSFKAVHVSNYGEEKYILELRGLESLSVETFTPNDSSAYNVHDVRDKKTGEVYKFFFNTTIPHTAMRNRAALEKESRPIVPKL